MRNRTDKIKKYPIRYITGENGVESGEAGSPNSFTSATLKINPNVLVLLLMVKELF